MNFNPLPRKEGDLEAIGLCLVKREDFNPLPRKEGDETYNVIKVTAGISIHSLVKRETARTAKQGTGAGISIHSLVKRETSIL